MYEINVPYGIYRHISAQVLLSCKISYLDV
jgi:hypothetical protein